VAKARKAWRTAPPDHRLEAGTAATRVAGGEIIVVNLNSRVAATDRAR
jgi:hypothetical protein